MSKELTISEQKDLANLYAESTLLPEAYRKKPADIFVAVTLGQSVGLSPIQSLAEINVIKGKPTMSATLIAAQVRRAGHKLRIEVEETPGKECAICTIIRRDDPEHPFVSKRDRAWAQRMGLLNNSNYIKQPATMLKKRAITDCARDACSEALCGINYTSDEMSDFDDVEATVEDESKTVVPTQNDESKTVGPTQNTEIVEAEIVEEKPEQPQTAPLATRAQRDKIIDILADAGIGDRMAAINYTKNVLVKDPTNPLQKDEAEFIIANRESVIRKASAYVRAQSTKRTQQQAEQQEKEQ